MTTGSVADAYFEQMFAASDDPWSMRLRWYERRKRALLLACLPREHYRSAFEPGCANGETTLALASRCERLLSCDTAQGAVQAARQRLAGIDHVRIERGRLPRDWPAEVFDLVVLNELGYYLDAADLQQVAKAAAASLSDDGHVLACHWREAIEGCPLDAEGVHRLLDQHLGLTRVLRHEEADFILEIWARDPRSVAQHEGLRADPGTV